MHALEPQCLVHVVTGDENTFPHGQTQGRSSHVTVVQYVVTLKQVVQWHVEVTEAWTYVLIWFITNCTNMS